MQNFDKTAFRQKVRSLVVNSEFAKVAEAITPYVRLRLYEESFADRVLAVRTVTESDLQTEVTNDSFYVVSHVEQATERALVANFIDRPVESYLAGERYKIPLGMHKTRQRQKNVHELKAYDYDILSDAADKDIYELGNLRDWKLLNMLNSCIDLSSKEHSDVIDAGTTGPVQIQKIHFNRLGAVLNTGGRTGLPSEDRLQVAKFLTHRQLIDDLALLDQNTFGDPLTGEMFTKGVTVRSVLGTEYIASIKERFFVEEDFVRIITLGGTSSSTTITVDGVAIAITDAKNGTDAATELIADINANATLAAQGVTAATVSAGVVRITKKAVANEATRTFTSTFALPTSNAGTTIADTSSGYNRYDVVWAFPEPQFMGEIVRVAGQDVLTEMWKTNGEDIVNSVSREWFGMGIGNFNGVAKLRIQRARHA